MKRKRIYISIPISGHDLEEVKEKVRKIREWILWDEFGIEMWSHRQDVITPFALNPTSHTRTIWARILKPC